MSGGAFQRQPAAAPLQRLSAAQRDALAQRLLPAWRAWCADWSLVRADVRVEPLLQGAARVRPSGGWTVAGRVGAEAGDAVGALLRESGRDAMTRAAMDLPGDTAWGEDSLAASLASSVEASWRAWRDGWMGAVSLDGDESCGNVARGDGPHGDGPHGHARHGHAPDGDPATASDLGDVVLIFSCVRARGTGQAESIESIEPVERTLRVAASALVRLLPPVRAGEGAPTSALAALAPLPRAIAHLPVRVRVRLGQAALQMGQLMDLQPGDVIPLGHPLARPAGLDLAEPGGHPLAAEARLGRSGAHWAVRVDPVPPTAS